MSSFEEIVQRSELVINGKKLNCSSLKVLNRVNLNILCGYAEAYELEDLSFNNLPINNLTLTGMATFPPCVKKINFGSCLLKDMRMLANCIANSNVTSLNISNNISIDVNDFLWLTATSKLEVLNLSGMLCINPIFHCVSLRELYLCDMGILRIDNLTEFLIRSNVEHLYLVDNRINDVSMLANKIEFTKLRILDMQHNNIYDLTLLFQNLQKCLYIEQFYGWSNPLLEPFKYIELYERSWMRPIRHDFSFNPDEDDGRKREYGINKRKKMHMKVIVLLSRPCFKKIPFEVYHYYLSLKFKLII